MTPPRKPLTIDKATTVNLGILLVMIGGFSGAGLYLGQLNSNVAQATFEIQSMRRAVDAHTKQLAEFGRAVAVLETLVAQQGVRLDRVETADQKK